MRIRSIALAGVLGVAGLGLIGVGSHAVFTTTTSSSQEITAGTPQVVTWSAAATNGCTTELIAAGNPSTCSSVTLPVETVGSTFDAYSIVHVTNIGNIAVDVTSLGTSDSCGESSGCGPVAPNSYYLEQALGLGVNFIGGSGDEYNGLLTAYSGFDTITPYTLGTPIPLGIGDSTQYDVDIYAGVTTTEYNGAGVVPALPNDASGGSDTVTLTIGYSG